MLVGVVRWGCRVEFFFFPLLGTAVLSTNELGEEK